MEKKHKQKFEDLKEFHTTYNEHEIILDSYDGAQSVNNAKKKINNISFRSEIFNERSVREIISIETGGRILIWIQQSGK